MPVELGDWAGSVRRSDTQPAVKLVTYLEQSRRGSSGTFRAICDDGRHWWVKPTNQLQQGKTIVTEQIVGRAASLIGAPVCELTLVEITPDAAGWEFRPGALTVPGICHGSANIDGPLDEDRTLRSRDRDDNRVRHAGMYALWDWCVGGDDQWLYAASDDERAYAHDLGHFLPGANNWTIATLTASVDQPAPPSWPASGVDVLELGRLADALDGVDRAALRRVVDGIPADWPVTNDELEAVGWVLERRAAPAASRLRDLARTVTGTSA